MSASVGPILLHAACFKQLLENLVKFFRLIVGLVFNVLWVFVSKSVAAATVEMAGHRARSEVHAAD